MFDPAYDGTAKSHHELAPTATDAMSSDFVSSAGGGQKGESDFSLLICFRITVFAKGNHE